MSRAANIAQRRRNRAPIGRLLLRQGIVRHVTFPYTLPANTFILQFSICEDSCQTQFTYLLLHFSFSKAQLSTMAATKRQPSEPTPPSSRPSKRVKTTSRPRPSKPYSKGRQATLRATALVTTANSLPLPSFAALYIPAALRTHTSTASAPATTFTLALHSTATLAPTDVDALVALVEETSGADYRASSAGWHGARKREEMDDRDMRFLVVRRGSDEDEGEARSSAGCVAGCAGFLSFALCVEGAQAVLYIYEIHLRAAARGLGVGGWLMDVAEAVGRAVGVAKAMLTVFATNVRAEALYRRRGYSEDSISPTVHKTRKGSGRPEYFILSKRLDSEDDSTDGVASRDAQGSDGLLDDQNGVKKGNDVSGNGHQVDDAAVEHEVQLLETKDKDRVKTGKAEAVS